MASKNAARKRSASKKRTSPSDVIDAVELRSIRMSEIVSKLNLDKGKLPHRINWNTHIETVLSDDRKAMKASLHCMAAGLYLDMPDDFPMEKLPFFIIAKFNAEYRLRDGHKLTDKEMTDFAGTLGPVHVWPYWRELVSSTSSRMGLPALLAPFLKQLAIQPTETK